MSNYDANNFKSCWGAEGGQRRSPLEKIRLALVGIYRIITSFKLASRGENFSANRSYLNRPLPESGKILWILPKWDLRELVAWKRCWQAWHSYSGSEFPSWTFRTCFWRVPELRAVNSHPLTCVEWIINKYIQYWWTITLHCLFTESTVKNSPHNSTITYLREPQDVCSNLFAILRYSCNRLLGKETASIDYDSMIYAFLKNVCLGSNVLDPPRQSDNEDKCTQGDGIERVHAINVL